MITVNLPSSEALAAASTAFTFALVGVGVLIVGSAVSAATWARSLNGWALGGVSFVLSQTAQVVALFLFGPLIAALPARHSKRRVARSFSLPPLDACGVNGRAQRLGSDTAPLTC